MKKIILTLLIAFVSVNAQTDIEIFGKKCAACHKENMPKEMTKELMKTFRAPPMAKISMKLKMKFKTQKEFVAFVTDYITNPSKDKSVCSERAIKNFGIMPPVGKSMTKKEKEDIANWLYTTFKSNGKGCDTKKANKCAGDGKCGGEKKMKPKTEDDKKMKCASGKCGTK
jgi:hypothetical protein